MYIYIEREREKEGMREIDNDSFLYKFRSFISITLIIYKLIWVPPSTRRCGLARGGSLKATIFPAAAVTRRDS